MSANADSEDATITAQNTGTGWLTLSAGEAASVSISGLTGTSSTIFLQRRFPGITSLDVTSFTANAEGSYVADERTDIRLFCKTGGYSSGTIVLHVGKG